jgi:8-oxo-dGTP diphosphatase
MKASIACIIFEDEFITTSTRILIALRDSSGQMANRWEFPGGKVEQGEDFTTAVTREILEEFGVTVRVGEEIAKTLYFHKQEPRELHAFRVFFSSPHPDFTLTEHTDTAWVQLQEVKNRPFVDSDLLLYDAVEAYMTANGSV